jgi:hypothetical protein
MAALELSFFVAHSYIHSDLPDIAKAFTKFLDRKVYQLN